MIRLMKSGYVGAMHAVGKLVGTPTPPRRRRLAHWGASLFAIHDIDRLVALDVPWWTYDAIEETEHFLAARFEASVFEWGSGASSIWLARRAAKVTSIEHDVDWLPIVEERLARQKNAQVRLVRADASAASDALYVSAKHGYEGESFEAYARAIEADDQKYDLIVIDGRARVACFHHAKDRLKPGGMILFDNSKRQRYAKAIDASGLPVRHHAGLTPSLPYPDRTSLVRPDGFAD